MAHLTALHCTALHTAFNFIVLLTALPCTKLDTLQCRVVQCSAVQQYSAVQGPVLHKRQSINYIPNHIQLLGSSCESFSNFKYSKIKIDMNTTLLQTKVTIYIILKKFKTAMQWQTVMA